jgi:hypothetical protein
MKFGGLFDCAKFKAHALSFLIYNNIETSLVRSGFF